MAFSSRDLTGLDFGLGHALCADGRDSQGKKQWKVRCACGQLYWTRTAHLTSGHTKSCGCLKKKFSIQVGDKIGRGEVLCKIPGKSRRALWKLKCQCGKEYIAREDCLVRGKTKSCGCLQKEKAADQMRAAQLLSPRSVRGGKR